MLNIKCQTSKIKNKGLVKVTKTKSLAYLFNTADRAK